MNLVYTWCLERVEPEKLDQWQLDLNDLLPWQDIESESAIEIESQSFFSMQAKGGR